MNRKIAALIAVATLALSLSACASPASGPSPSPQQEPPKPSDTTLNGGVVLGDGVSIRELTVEDDAVSGIQPGMVRESDNSFVIEAGGSGSEACRSNFTAIERNGEEFTLNHQEGDGSEGIICTRDYRFTYFLIEADEPISDAAIANIVSKGEVVRTLNFEFVAQ